MNKPEADTLARTSTLAELRGALRLAGVGIEAATTVTEDMHRAISSKPLRLLAQLPAGEVARGIHDGVRSGVYACIRGVSRGVFAVVDGVLAHGGDSLQPRHRLPGPLIGLLQGIVGDHIARDRNPLASTMHLRATSAAGGQPLALTREALAAAFPDASPRPTVLVHGLAADESCWQLGSLKAWGRPGLDYGALLAERAPRERGITPLYVRYNSGLRIADNGRALAALLAELADLWPVPIERLTLIGHSMGGLVVRSACHHGQLAEAPWTHLVRDVVCLGAPQRGAVLEKLGAAAVDALAFFDVTAPIARVFDARSAGIKDLRHGTIVDTDNTDEHHLPGARYHDLAGTLGGPNHPLSWALGDGLVRPSSATPERPGATTVRARTTRLDGVGHLAMLSHPGVLAWLETALAD
jgi:triacylglycerol lipase